MDETERLMVAQASKSLDPAHKALLYEVMKKNVGLVTLIALFIPGGGLRLSMAMKCSLGATKTLNDRPLSDTVGCSSKSMLIGKPLDKRLQSA